jgi:hypothetical protein
MVLNNPLSGEADQVVILDDKGAKYCQGPNSATSKGKDEKGFIKKKIPLKTRNPNKTLCLEFTDIQQGNAVRMLPLRLQKKKGVHNQLTWIFHNGDSEKIPTL